MAHPTMLRIISACLGRKLLWIELPLDLITGLISLIYPLLDGLVSSDIFPHAFLAMGFALDA